MAIVNVMKRKDATSVMVAVVIALFLEKFISNVTFDLANNLSGIEQAGLDGGGWQNNFLAPLVALVLQLLVLELVVWLYASAKDAFGKK